MPLIRRIFVSLPSERALTGSRNEFKLAIFNEIKARLGASYSIETLSEPALPGGTTKAWSGAELDRRLRGCVGAVIIGMARWRGLVRWRFMSFASEYCHYEGAAMHTLGLPVLTLLDKSIENRGIFHGDRSTVVIPPKTVMSWFKSREFCNAFDEWFADIQKRSDVFLAYSSSPKSAQLVPELTRAFTADRVKVLDWKSGFLTGATIIESLIGAVAQCSAGVFLLTKDDELRSGLYVPRDNVVFEAGLFCHAKGKERALLIMEKGAKKPTDLDGVIHVEFDDPSQLTSVNDKITRFIKERL